MGSKKRSIGVVGSSDGFIVFEFVGLRDAFMFRNEGVQFLR